MDILTTALYWLKMGIAIIPINYYDKRPDAKLLPKNDKGEASWEIFQQQLPTEQMIKNWFPGYMHNLGVVTGWKNLVVIDFDSYEAYNKWQVWLVGRSAMRTASMAYKVKTARGVHVYFCTSEKSNNAKLPEIDVKGNRGYVLAPPSIHPSGVAYTILQPGMPAFINALSDVLPADLLHKYTELPNFVTVPAAPKTLSSDPWETAENPVDPDKDLVDQVRASHKVEDFFPTAEWSGSHRWKLTSCPWHDDKHPSFWIDVQRQICGCHSCQMKPMDSINLYAQLHSLSNRDAIFYLAKM